MIKVKKIAFNPFQVNTYVVYDETKECAIIDAGCSDKTEQDELVGYIEHEGLKPVALLNTHLHIDHIVGNVFVSEYYNLDLQASFQGNNFLKHAVKTAHIYGFELDRVIYPKKDLKEGETINFGNSKLEIIETPGHANGSVCFIGKNEKFIIVGDVLFYQSIGRTDLPTGNYDLLLDSIGTKVFTLGDDFKVYSGHGPDTSIGFEKISNPFLADI